jgi:tripartite motif-containing protein 71
VNFFQPLCVFLLPALLLASSEVEQEANVSVTQENGQFVVQIRSPTPAFLRLKITLSETSDPGLEHRTMVAAGVTSLRISPPSPGRYRWDTELETLNFGAAVPVGARGSGPGHFRDLTYLDLTPEGSILVSDRGNHRVQVLTSQGRHRLSLRLGGLGSGGTPEPAGVGSTPAGRILVADLISGQVSRFSREGRPLGDFLRGTPTPRPGGLTVLRGRDVLICIPRRDRIHHLGSSGQLRRSFGGFGSAAGRVRGPEDVARADDESFWVSESGNHRIQRFRLSGGSLGQFQGSLQRPQGLTVDWRGLIYVADRGTRSIHCFHPELGEILVLGGPSGPFREPWDVAAPNDGSLLISDRKANVLWRLPSTSSVLYKTGQVSLPSVR